MNTITTKLPRREFLKAAGLGAAALAMPRELLSGPGGPGRLPNVLWISVEDISPTLGCYGDKYATTPNLDRFASQGVRYEWAFTHAPVCAPARSGIITGMYPTTIGTTWMRCRGVPPAEARCFPEYLRAAGYYCANNSKTDYQFAAPITAWDECSRHAHWRNRPSKDQPFFAVFNLTVTHESSTRNFKPGQKFQHDPAKAPLPPYWPDTPLVRQNVACYYDRMSELDAQAQKILDELEADGLADDTIVWFWGDHGWGLTRGKRWIYDSGIRVPLLVRVPPKYRKWAGCGDEETVAPGRVEQDFARFLDFAPTMLSLAGVPIPPHMQGRAFLGPQKAKPPRFIFAARDRMDETLDCIRCVRDKRYKLIRNFMPYLSRAQHIEYMDRTPILQEMRRLYAAGKLKPGPQMQYFEPTKPVFELYDVIADPDEVHNLAGRAEYKAVVERMNRWLEDKMKAIGDVGLIPEPDFDEMKGGGTTAPPTIMPGKPTADGTVRVTLTCPTRGASIAYRIIRRTGGARGGSGQVVLSAEDAKIHGRGAKKGRDAIISWRGKNTSVSWSVTLTGSGKRNVWLRQANAGPGGSQFELAVGDQKLTGTIRHTKSWNDYTWVKVGQIELPAAGTHELTIRPIKQVGGRLGNVAAVAIGGLKPPAAGRDQHWLLYN
ncbi:MAG: sulfatase-like hydrolase/transferase, partial [Planctomycetes bacterium]|nr:sulfatase-like hydrolase/transferase [Planctomycetota bacterium]